MYKNQEKFLNELKQESFKACIDYNRNTALKKASEILYKYYPNANMMFENRCIDYFINLIELEFNQYYIEDCIENYYKH